MEKVAEIQRRITSDVQNIRPRRLAVELPEDHDGPLKGGIGTTWGLSQIADGRRLDEAVQAFSWSSEAEAAIRAVYDTLAVDADRPAQAARAQAARLLGPLRLR
jgi:hypothetical protein